MKKVLILLIVIVAVVGGLVYLKNNTASTSTLPNGSVIVDVRSPDEYNAGHVKGAINWPIEEIREKKTQDVGTGSDLYVYCRSGNRSAEAAQILNDMGYNAVIDMGGLDDLSKYGLKVE